MKEEKPSQMMQHYFGIKEQYKDIIIFYRLGDFYELFYEDAILCSRVLELTLTSKSCGLKEKAPMCGVPAKSCDIYLKKLLSMGYKVGICEQVSEPNNNYKELVKREVVRIVTPGTVMEDDILEEKKNNYIACVYFSKEYYIAFADISTGEFYITTEPTLQKLNDFLVMINPAEIICNSEMKLESINLSAVKQNNVPSFTEFELSEFSLKNSEDLFYKQFHSNNYKVFEITNNKELIAVGALLSYLFKTQKRDLTHINKVKYYYSSDYMYLDVNTRRNLELTTSGKDNKKKGSLLWLLDETKTAMGGRMLRNFIEQPLHDDNKINYRLNGVEELFNNIQTRESLQEVLNIVTDLERLSGKISYNSITPRECVSIKNSLLLVPKIKGLMQNLKTDILVDIYNNLNEFKDIASLIDSAIKDDISKTEYKDGGFIKSGFDTVFDDYKEASSKGKGWIADLEKTEKEETGIKNLRIDYNRVFGYFIEVTNSQKDLVPYRYKRVQTLTNAERFTTDELKDLEGKVLQAHEKAVKRELELFEMIKARLRAIVPDLQNSARNLGILDALLSFANVATKYDYVKPRISRGIKEIKIVDGRHPVIEKLIGRDEFISNDTLLDNGENRTMIITGPNMAGKSTYMRQVALITLMAHIGSFVPAKEAEIGLTDRIFTRIGASDDLIYGQSTFMVEMTEVANILSNATNDSLILFDELGRGTATYDGLSIAWSVMEYLSKHIKAKTLFSTHYHELTELEGKLDGVKNYRVTVKEFNNNIIFLRKIVRGGANRSFGIEVARLAGLPEELIQNSKSILSSLEEKEAKNSSINQLNLPPRSVETLNMLKEIDLNKISPLEAFSILTNLKERL